MVSTIPEKMSAVVYRGANDLRIEEVPVPAIGPRELLVRVKACGVCPTDIKKIKQGALTPPRIFGHETAGVVADVGSGIEGFRVGDRVALHHHVPCLECHACRHGAYAQCPQYKKTGTTAGFEPAGGGYAEYVRVMEGVLPGVVRIPDKNSFSEGAMLEPVNTVLKGVRRLGLLQGDSVVVVGQGPIGLLFTQLLAMEGQSVVTTELLTDRVAQSRKFGAQAIDLSDTEDARVRILAMTDGHAPDAVVVTVPSDSAVRDGLAMVRGGGKVLLFGHTARGSTAPIELATVCADEKDVIGSYSSDFTLQTEVARLVFERHIDVRSLISHALDLAHTPTAVEMAAHPKPGSLKVMVMANSDESGIDKEMGRVLN